MLILEILEEFFLEVLFLVEQVFNRRCASVMSQSEALFGVGSRNCTDAQDRLQL
jgi:hypothetical protein